MDSSAEKSEARKPNKIEGGIEAFIFASRWFQAPMYIGLVIGGCFYSWRFMVELVEMIKADGMNSSNALMMSILTMVDYTMIGQLLIMIIIGGWNTFVSKIRLSHEDRPEWLDTVNAGILKVKMASSLVNISGIQLLQTFFSLKDQVEHNQPINEKLVIFQIVIHITFLISSIVLSWVEKLTEHKAGGGH